MVAGQALFELSKEKSSQKQAESHTHQFLKALSHVESKLTEQINYLTQVSTGQPHEGSGYASQKVLQMAWHRLQHIRSRLIELECIKPKYMGNRPAARNVAAAPGSGNAVPTTAATAVPTGAGTPTTPSMPGAPILMGQAQQQMGGPGMVNNN
ncbi:hypothetical protein B566_EDAN009740 [Ephemera danica]|nr:hypothetical protein B566_EDAN009740 [Ephemera danica]